MSGSKKKLGEILVEAGEITRSQLADALAFQKTFNDKLGQCLVLLGYVSETRMCEVLSRQLRIPVIDLARIKLQQISPEVLKLFEPEFIISHQVFPLALRQVEGSEKLVIVSPDPTNFEVLQEIEFKTGHRVFPMIATVGSVKKMISQLYKSPSGLKNTFDPISCIKNISSEMEIIRTSAENPSSPGSGVTSSSGPRGQLKKPVD